MSININEEPILKHIQGGSEADISFLKELKEYATVMLSKTGGGYKNKLKKGGYINFFQQMQDYATKMIDRNIGGGYKNKLKKGGNIIFFQQMQDYATKMINNINQKNDEETSSQQKLSFGGDNKISSKEDLKNINLTKLQKYAIKNNINIKKRYNGKIVHKNKTDLIKALIK